MNQTTSETGTPWLRSAATVAAIAALAWYVLLGDDPASWVVGVPCVLLCAWFSRSIRLAPRLQVSLSGWLRLLPYFLWKARLIKVGYDITGHMSPNTLEKEIKGN